MGRFRFGHAQAAGEMPPKSGLRALTENGISRSPRSIAFGTARLCHETLQDAMKDEFVVETLFDEADEIAERSYQEWEINSNAVL